MHLPSHLADHICRITSLEIIPRVRGYPNSLGNKWQKPDLELVRNKEGFFLLFFKLILQPPGGRQDGQSSGFWILSFSFSFFIFQTRPSHSLTVAFPWHQNLAASSWGGHYISSFTPKEESNHLISGRILLRPWKIGTRTGTPSSAPWLGDLQWEGAVPQINILSPQGGGGSGPPTLLWVSLHFHRTGGRGWEGSGWSELVQPGNKQIPDWEDKDLLGAIPASNAKTGQSSDN